MSIRLLGSAMTILLSMFSASLYGFAEASGLLKDSAPPIHLPNIRTPTLGGKQVWADEYIHAGWRIQHNIISGHYRLLDPNNIRHAWGTYEVCKHVSDAKRKERPVQSTEDHLILLIHGIGRSTGTFTNMKAAMLQQGHAAVSVSYPSTRRSIEAHAAQIARLISNLENTKRISFVTHSMGGLVVRKLLARNDDWKTKITVDSIVQIAPPNQGSAIARWLKDNPLYKTVSGPAGQELTPEATARLPPLKHVFSIIAGGRNTEKGYNPLLPGDDDGTVSVKETYLAGASDFLIIPAIHARLSNDPRTIKATLNFLRLGRFHPSKRKAATLFLGDE